MEAEESRRTDEKSKDVDPHSLRPSEIACKMASIFRPDRIMKDRIIKDKNQERG
jgi:hypothetical protein